MRNVGKFARYEKSTVHQYMRINEWLAMASEGIHLLAGFVGFEEGMLHGKG